MHSIMVFFSCLQLPEAGRAKQAKVKVMRV